MLKKLNVALVIFLTLLSLLLFLVSCLITLSDGQGAMVFIVSVPLMGILIACAILFSRKIMPRSRLVSNVVLLPKIVGALISLFFLFAVIPSSRGISDYFMDLVQRGFTFVTGQTPYAFLQDFSSFPRKMNRVLSNGAQKEIAFKDLNASFAWDELCIFGPYTHEEKAKSILKIDWNIEQYSQIHYSDSINALVFIYQRRVNKVVDLRRGIADFMESDVCLSQDHAKFKITYDAHGRRILTIAP